MSVVDNSGISDSINTIVYRSMKEKLVKYENVLSKIMQGQPLQSMSDLSSQNAANVGGNKGVPLNNRERSISPVSNNVDYDASTPGREVDLSKSPSNLSQNRSYNQDNDHSISREPNTLPINISLAPLDYDKIKKYLVESDDELMI